MFEIDLHGYPLNQALEIAEDFIVDKYHKGAKQIKIIHGRGDGTLKMEIRKLLDSLKEKSYRLVWNESEESFERGAVTIVNFFD